MATTAPRNFRWEDLPSLLEVTRQARHADGDLRALDQASLEEALRDPGLDPEEHCYLFGSGSQLEASLTLHHEPPLRRTVLEANIHPEYRSEELRTSLLRTGMEQATALGSRVVHFCLPQEDQSWAGALSRAGLALARSYWLMRWQEPAPPDSPPPEGFSVRPFQPGEGSLLARVQNAAFGQSWGFSPNTPEQAEYRATMSLTGPGGILLLEHKGDIAGYCWTLTEKTRQGGPIGTICMIGIHPSYRSRGLSRPILASGMQHLCSKNVDHIKLDVDASNEPAIALYTRVGFKKMMQLQWFEAVLSGT